MYQSEEVDGPERSNHANEADRLKGTIACQQL